MFTVAGQPVAVLELVAFAAGLASVWFARRLRIVTWPAGIVAVLCLAVVFYRAALYANALLQVAFVAVSVYGWWRWSRRGPTAPTVTHVPVREALLAGALGVAGTVGVALWLQARTDSPAPWPDAAILAASLVATGLQARQRIECWLVWIAVDLVAVPLYWSRGLALTTALYLVFMLLCLAGWLDWARRLQVTPSPTS